MKENESLIITYDYPHSLMFHLKHIIRDKGMEILKDKEFPRIFYEMYPEEKIEWNIVSVSQKKGIFQRFLAARKGKLWQKRTCVAQSLYLLVSDIGERNSVILVESMMCILRWEFQMEIERKWEVSEEDRALFHEKIDLSELNFLDARTQIQHQEGNKKDSFKDKEVSDVGLADIISIAAGEMSSNIVDSMAIAEDGEVGKPEKNVKNDEPQMIVRKGKRKAEDNQQETEKKVVTTVKERKVKFFNQMGIGMRREVKQAKKGNANAQQKLGDFYTEENSNHVDYQEAIYWYELSAKQNNFTAQMQLGKIYDSGKIQQENSKQQGLFWYRKLAKEGFPTAQCIMGLKYLWGDGVKADKKEALFWLRKAANQGCKEAEIYLKSYDLSSNT